MKYQVQKSFIHRIAGFVHLYRDPRVVDGEIDLPNSSREDKEANASLVEAGALVPVAAQKTSKPNPASKSKKETGKGLPSGEGEITA